MTTTQLDRLRAYLGYYYAVSKYVLGHPHTRPLVAYHPSYMTAWKRMDLLACPWTPWTATCCDLLQRCAEADGDLALCYLARLASATNTANKSIRDNNAQSAQQVQLLLLGLEAQHRELKEAMLPHIARSGKHLYPYIQPKLIRFSTRKVSGPLLRCFSPRWCRLLLNPQDRSPGSRSPSCVPPPQLRHQPACLVRLPHRPGTVRLHVLHQRRLDEICALRHTSCPSLVPHVRG